MCLCHERSSIMISTQEEWPGNSGCSWTPPVPLLALGLWKWVSLCLSVPEVLENCLIAMVTRTWHRIVDLGSAGSVVSDSSPVYGVI